MDFEIKDEARYIKWRFIFFYLTSFILVTGLTVAILKMLPQYKQQRFGPATPGSLKEEQKVLFTQEMLYEQFDQLREVSEYNMNASRFSDTSLRQNLQKMALQATQSFKETLDSIEKSKSTYTSERNRNILQHSVSSFRFLLTKPINQTDITNFASSNDVNRNKSEDKLLELKASVLSKEAEIADLKKQLNSSQKNTNDNVSVEKYNALLSDLKYLNFDLRSVIVQNLDLTKSNNALKKANEELSNEIRKLSNN